MSKWRIILTDSESESGVAPVCVGPGHPIGSESWVFDCCPGPHLECWSERNARRVLTALNAAECEVCS